MKTVKSHYINVPNHHESTHFELLIPIESIWLDETYIEDTLILSFLVDTEKPLVTRKFKLVVEGDEVGPNDCHMESFHGIKHLFETIEPTKLQATFLLEAHGTPDPDGFPETPIPVVDLKVRLDDQQVDRYVRRSVREHEEDRLDSMGL